MDVKPLRAAVWVVCEDLVDLAGDVSLEAAEGFATGLAFGDAAGEVVAGTGVSAQAGQGALLHRREADEISVVLGPIRWRGRVQ